MTSIFEFIAQLNRKDIKLWLDGQQLRINAPEGTLSPALIAQLKKRKSEIMAFLRQHENRSLVTTIQPVARTQSQPQPLSFAQQRLWFLAQLDGASDAYNIPAALHLEGPLDVVAFTECWKIICERHEALRTTFPIVDSEARQQINPPSFELDLIDLSDLPSDQKEAEVARLCGQETQRRFDLINGPLWRVSLLRLEEESHVLLVTMHHIISDGWSIGVLVRELSALYEQMRTAGQKRTAEAVTTLSVQYADFAVWQREWLQGERLQTQLAYWKAQLADAPPLLSLPTDHARPLQQSYRGHELSFRLPRSLYAELTSLSQKNNATLFMTLQAAFAVLLWRYSGEEDILIGTPIANRQVAEVEHLIGFFVNTLVLRNDLSGNPSFRDFLASVRQTTLDAYQHQALPFELLVETLQPERSLAHSPLFQVMFILQNNREQTLSFSGLTVTPLEVEYPIAKFDLTLAMEEREEGLSASWEYNTDLFERATIERMAGHFHTLLEGILANPDQSIAHLPLLSDQEKDQLLHQWNATPARRAGMPARSTPYPSQLCIHQWFEQQVERTPEAIALLFPAPIGAEQGEAALHPLTYRELNARANQLAHYLVAQGVGPDVLVGLCVERSIEMIVGVLGILKAGGAYVPLDPSYPAERLTFMLEDAELEILLTQKHLQNSLRVPKSVQVLCLDSDWPQIAQQRRENLFVPMKASNLAYVIYTSGSTGRPKGVLVQHDNVVRLMTATEAWYHFNEKDVWTLFHSVAFDFSVWEIWGALLYGGRLVVVPYFLSRSPELFYQLLCREKVTVLNQTPSAFKQLSRAEELAHGEDQLALRYVIFGGEALEFASLEAWFDRHGDQSPQLINMYGITETTVHVTYRPVTRADLSQSASLIGEPIPDLQLYILDAHQQLVPNGIPGELYVGGAGVSRGYLNRPRLNIERFVPKEHLEFNSRRLAHGCERLYRTGDLARRLPNGDLEYLGRIDNQVKIRGFRIELGEIEAALTQHPDVREALVLVKEDEAGHRYLAAYLIAKDKQSARMSQLHSYLAGRLPDYMIPATFITLDRMPLTSNGKIDRKALPEPDSWQSLRSSDYVPPRTPREALLVEIWRDVLHHDVVGIHDNFFELGGHSLLATQVVSRIRQSLQVELPLRRLFSAPTIAELAKQLGSTEHLLPPLRPLDLDHHERAQPLPLSFAQQRLWFLAQFEGMNDVYNISAALRFSGPLDIAAFSATWQEIEARHEVLRTTFPIVDGKAYQQINAPSFNPLARTSRKPPSFTLEIIDLSDWPSDQQEAEVLRLAQEEGIRAFDLINGPLWRVSLLRLKENSHVLLVTMHHIISDGWSIGVLIREFSALYEQKRTAPTGMPARGGRFRGSLPVQYADFAVWQRGWLQGELLEAQLAYWKAQLADAPPLLSLPTDHARPAVQSYRGAHLSFMLPKALHDELVSLSQKQSTTLFMTLQAAFAILLSRYAGQEDILIGTPIANRQVAEVEDLIGFFVNTLVLRNDLSGNPTFADFLARVRQTALDAYQHQALPFELLVETLEPERSLSHSPLFQVMFILQNNRQETLSFSDITVSPIEVEYPVAKFDLTLAMEEREEGLSASWEYNSDLFEQATIERMAGQFQTLLESIVANTDKSIAHLPLLSERERYQLLVEWNDTQADYPSDKCIHQLFEQQVERTPEAIAVVFADEKLTYRQLNARANQLAHHLIAQGVGPDVLVGICVERSIQMVVGVLGVLKAGGAYVPLDPSYPTERLEFMLDDANVKVLLTCQKLATMLPQQVPQLLLDQDGWYGPDHPNPVTPARSEQLAYCIYTSGSTGRPKGVMVEHRHVQALLSGFELIAPKNKKLIGTSVCPFSFDVSVWELFSTLCFGGTLHILSLDILADSKQFASYLAAHQVTSLYIPPALLSDLVTELEMLKNEIYIDRMLVGVEPIKQGLLQRFRDLSDDLRIINGYGPTESTVCATFFNFKTALDANRRTPIGKAVANYEVYLVDEYLQPVPIGVPGELHIGGAGVARGYLNRPELTSKKFIPNPFSPSKVGPEGTPGWGGARLYKTGDLCRYLPDTQGAGSGNIEFLGRTDYQVKIRGFRIELGEIEAALNSQLGVQEAVVVVRSGTSGKQLVAYFVPIGHDIIEDDFVAQKAISGSTLRAYLSEKLPDYMIPSAFVLLDTMPLLPNGKIDRRALAERPVERGEANGRDSAQLVLPRTPKEEILAGIWQEVLGQEVVGIHNNFFEIGGHSLLATQVVSRIRQSLQVELPLRELFSAPTIAQLAKQLHSSEQLLPPLTPLDLDHQERAQPLPLSFAQQRLWFLAQLEGTSEAYNVPAALRLEGPLDLAAFSATWQEIEARHEILRTTFPIEDGQARQQINAPSVNPSALRQAQGTAGSGHRLEIIDLSDWPSDQQEAEVMRLAEQENVHPFDLINGPLWRVMLLRLEEESHVLLLTMHHIISDGWSIGVLIREFSALYEQKRTAGQKRTAEAVTTLTVQYADFAVLQRGWLQGELLEAQLAYWKAQLADAPPLLSLPTDYARPALQSNRGDRISFALSEGLSKELTHLSSQSGATLFMTLQAAFAVLLSRYSAQEDILIGTPIANRQVAEVEDLIGFFVNTLVLRNDLSGNPTFADFLARVRQTALDAYQHQALPFELLVETLQPERSLSHSPLFQVMFVLQNNRQETLSFSDITIRPIEVDYPIAKFDLTLGIEPHQKGLSAWWEYNTDLFERGTIERMAENFQVLLEGIVANPDQPIAQLPLLSERERYQLLVEWNDLGMPARVTRADYRCHLGIHQLFEQQVARTPEPIAVIYPSMIDQEGTLQQGEAEQLTYRELNARANQLAHTLMAQGVGPNVLVGLCVERSIEMIVGLLGILKAGGAYVPLDPAYPQGRLAFILNDAQPAVLVTQAAIEARLPAHTVPVVCLDRDWELISQASPTSPISHTEPDQIAYVIYTSGSTGEPKGVLISHRSLLNHSYAMMAEYELTAQDRVLQFASISFDVAAEELFPSWLSGATVLLRPGHIALSFAELAKFVDHHCLTLLNLPASYWHEWVLALSEGSSYVPSSLRLLVVGSEKVEHERLMRWQQLVDRPIGWRNAYGPTEATITATLYNPAQREDESYHSIPIGRPIANTELYILDQGLQPVPIGVPGELHIGGLGLALGYLNRPELTKAKFIEHPFSDEAGARLYKTGDLCRYRPNGDLEFIGRIDHQVKIHGFRIELGEIESCLMQIESISEAVVCPEQNNPSSLLAYLVLNNSLTVSGRTYQVHTALSNPSLQKQMEQVHLHVWPRFFMGDAVNVQYWPHLYDTFPAYQSAIIDAGEVVAACNAIPLYWDGQQESLPTGWDDAVLRGFEGHKKGILPNTLCILVGSIRQSHQSQGLSYELIKIMKSLAYSIEGIQYVIAPVRPTHKRRYPDMTLEQYCEQKREDGLSLDPWLRVHERLGGTILAYSHQSQLVEGTISQWELWTGQTICQSGEYLFEGSMQPVTIDIEQNSGQYYDLAVWMSHTAEPYLSFNPADVTPKALRAKLAQSLPDYMIPAAFVPLGAMPLLPNGKIDRRALSALGVAESDLFSSTTFMAPRSQTEQQLAHIWQEVLGIHSVGIRDSFFDLGGHSLLAVRLMAQIQQRFGVNLPLATLFESPTIEQLATRLADGQAKADWSVLVPIQPNGDKLPFFCLPGDGGNVIGLYDLARLMEAEQPFYGLQAVGLDGETAPYATVEAIAAHNINAIQKIQPQGPYLLGGHSFGGLVAFEMGQQLLKAGHQVANVILFDTFAPSEERTFALDEASWDDAKWLVSYAETIGQLVGQKSRLSYEHLLTLDAEAQLLSFKEELERFNLWPTGSDLKLLRGLLQVLKTNSLIKYVPQGGIPTPITLFSAQERPAEQPERAKEQPDDPTYGWQPFAKGPVNVISVPGDHTTMMVRPHIELLARRLREVLHKTH